MPWQSPPIETYDQRHWLDGPILGHDERGPGFREVRNNGDWSFSTGYWRTRHGAAPVARMDAGALESAENPPSPPKALLAASPRIMALLQDDWFARGAADMLGARQSFSIADAAEFNESARTVGGIVASLRGLGENYMDLYSGLFAGRCHYDWLQIEEELAAAGLRLERTPQT